LPIHLSTDLGRFRIVDYIQPHDKDPALGSPVRLAA